MIKNGAMAEVFEPKWLRTDHGTPVINRHSFGKIGSSADHGVKIKKERKRTT